MQALTPTLMPCYAAADRETARRIAEFLEAGAGVRVLLREGEMQGREDLASKAREARMADIVLVLFSQASLPSPWPRYKWEAALKTEPAQENVRIGFLKCDDCSPPKVLAPQFDMTGLPPAALRRLKRWVRNGEVGDPAVHYPELAGAVEQLGAAIADRPGVEIVQLPELALEFARIFREDFDEVIRLECGGRSLVALAGDLATQLGMRLDGQLAENLERLRSFCAGRRLLLWLEGASGEEADELAVGQGSSTLVTTQPRAEAPAEDESLRDIQYILRHPGMIGEWAELCRLARQGFRLAREQGRLAEAHELMDQWLALAETRGDRRIMEEASREVVWILESWDRVDEAQELDYRRARDYGEQMLLF